MYTAGTTDGPGMFSFVQGSNSTKDNPFFNFIAHFLSNPSKAEIACQAPKPILLNIGHIAFPGSSHFYYYHVYIYCGCVLLITMFTYIVV